MTASSIQDLKRQLSEMGLQATRQRIDLLMSLRKAKHPLAAEKLAATLAGKMNLTTVYRGLDQLSGAGLVRRIDLGKNHALYEMAGAHHHHLVCRTCGVIEDVTACIPDVVFSSVLKKANKFSAIEDHALEFFGTCKSCYKKK